MAIKLNIIYKVKVKIVIYIVYYNLDVKVKAYFCIK